MKILITGASGLIGTRLSQSFAKKGVDVLQVTRSEARDEKHITWDPETGFDEKVLPRLDGVDAAIHLAGENISAIRWTEEKKKAIRDSRVHGTRTLVDTFAKLKTRPKLFISASAVGFYGDRADEVLTEGSSSGMNFLAEICREWEAESRRAEDLGIRTVLLRTGIVLSKEGGALATMLTPFSLGLGGVVGSGKQWMSWVSLDDVEGIIDFVIENEHLRGAINVAAPNPATNEEFTKTLGEVLFRPTILPVPNFAVHMLFGEMGDILLLSSIRAVPKRLLEAGYKFKFAELKPALKAAMGNTDK